MIIWKFLSKEGRLGSSFGRTENSGVLKGGRKNQKFLRKEKRFGSSCGRKEDLEVLLEGRKFSKLL